MFDINNLMGKVKEAQEQMKKAQDQLSELIETAESGAGMVKATVNGKKEVLKIEIDPSLMTIDDKKTVEDLCVAAVNIALKKIEEKSQALMQNSIMQGMPNIPGFDLNNFKL